MEPESRIFLFPLASVHNTSPKPMKTPTASTTSNHSINEQPFFCEWLARLRWNRSSKPETMETETGVRYGGLTCVHLEILQQPAIPSPTNYHLSLFRINLTQILLARR